MNVPTFQCPDCGDYFPLAGIDSFFRHAMREHSDGIGAKVVAVVVEELTAEILRDTAVDVCSDCGLRIEGQCVGCQGHTLCLPECPRCGGSWIVYREERGVDAE